MRFEGGGEAFSSSCGLVSRNRSTEHACSRPPSETLKLTVMLMPPVSLLSDQTVLGWACREAFHPRGAPDPHRVSRQPFIEHLGGIAPGPGLQQGVQGDRDLTTPPLESLPIGMRLRPPSTLF